MARALYMKNGKRELLGRTVRVLTPDERIADMEAFGREIRQSKSSASAFLIRAGILDKTGQLTKPYRTN
jgi:hypothetical protein